MSMKRYILTTVDNPYDPVEQEDAWRSMDFLLALQHNRATTESLLDSFCISSINLMDGENQRNINDAVDDIIRLMPELYRKIVIEE